VRVTCIVALAYAIGAIEDRADKGNLMYQSELISFKTLRPRGGVGDGEGTGRGAPKHFVSFASLTTMRRAASPSHMPEMSFSKR
jgi:hypothetical protein